MGESINSIIMDTISKARTIANSIGEPIIEEGYYIDDTMGDSYNTDELSIDCFGTEQSVSVHIRVNGIRVLYYSSDTYQLIYTYGKWIDLIDDIYNRLDELIKLKDINISINIINGLKEYYSFYSTCDEDILNNINEELNKEGIIVITKKCTIKTDITMGENGYPIYQDYNLYTILFNNKEVAAFREGDFTSSEYANTFINGNWVNIFKDIINKYNNSKYDYLKHGTLNKI